MAKKTGAILVLVALTLVAASPTAFSQHTAPAIGAQRSGAAQGPSASTVRFKTLSYVDRQGTGTEAFRMLVPSDWQFQGGIAWVLDNPGMPAYAGFRIHNPAGAEEFEVFPNQPITDCELPAIRCLLPGPT